MRTALGETGPFLTMVTRQTLKVMGLGLPWAGDSPFRAEFLLQGPAAAEWRWGGRAQRVSSQQARSSPGLRAPVRTHSAHEATLSFPVQAASPRPTELPNPSVQRALSPQGLVPVHTGCGWKCSAGGLGPGQACALQRPRKALSEARATVPGHPGH